ncbi:hypothetical protein CKAN_02552100 [Cinnamomum micranthum f. kanehirae]|uniref:Uncharacterized protein n=1 Tax=Cinnamomum micranthum f. kanehirae TaxID=337451 RepID=A0A443PZE5_9MAGN|nr:hypothetical protein CKAN_02552100 [Cinnamomum micranthum f. kanehirae]
MNVTANCFDQIKEMVRWNAYIRRGDSFGFVAYVNHNQNVAMKASGSLSLLIFFLVLTILLVPEAMVWAATVRGSMKLAQRPYSPPPPRVMGHPPISPRHE